MSAREGTNALDRAIEAVVGTIGRFSGKDATSYLASYSEERRLAGFPRVAMPSIHTEVLKVRAESWTWEQFEGRLLKKYGLDDALRHLKRDFMEWVETPDKGRNASVLLRVEYQCTMDVFTLSSLRAQVWAICVISVKGS